MVVKCREALYTVVERPMQSTSMSLRINFSYGFTCPGSSAAVMIVIG